MHPLPEHQPYDIVAIDKNGVAIKLQAKYVTLKSNGTIEVRFRMLYPMYQIVLSALRLYALRKPRIIKATM